MTLRLFAWCLCIFAAGFVIGITWGESVGRRNGVRATEELHEEWIREYNLDKYDMRDKIGEALR